MRIKLIGGIAAAIIIVAIVALALARQWYFPGSNLPSCGDSQRLFDHLPVASADYDYLIPLGSVSPPEHTFPIDHMYFQRERQAGSISPVTVTSPGDGMITQIRRNKYIGERPDNRPEADYSIFINPCNEVSLFFFHIEEVPKNILSQVDWNRARCDSYSTGQSNIEGCEVNTNIPIESGQTLGVAGTVEPRVSFDMGLTDERPKPLKYANDRRWHPRNFTTHCPLDYFTPQISQQLQKKLEASGGTSCGRIDTDVPGSLQGSWFWKEADSNFPEDKHLSLVPDVKNSKQQIVSAGTSLESIGVKSGRYYFTFSKSSNANLDFSQANQVGTTYCYEAATEFGNPDPKPVTFLIKLTSTDTIEVANAGSSNCANAPSISSLPTVTFER